MRLSADIRTILIGLPADVGPSSATVFFSVGKLDIGVLGFKI